MMRSFVRTTLLLLPFLAACEDRVPTAQPTIPAPFTEKDNVVPVALDPNRPQPPPPSMMEVSRGQERVPPAAPEQP